MELGRKRLNWNMLLQPIYRPLYSILPPEIVLHLKLFCPDELLYSELKHWAGWLILG
jgi:hypothetical protein